VKKTYALAKKCKEMMSALKPVGVKKVIKETVAIRKKVKGKCDSCGKLVSLTKMGTIHKSHRCGEAPGSSTESVAAEQPATPPKSAPSSPSKASRAKMEDEEKDEEEEEEEEDEEMSSDSDSSLSSDSESSCDEME
jgi:hypothetical protein